MQTIKNTLWLVVGIVSSIAIAEKVHERTKLTPVKENEPVAVSASGANQQVSLRKEEVAAAPVAKAPQVERQEKDDTIQLLKLMEPVQTQSITFNRLGVNLLVPSNDVPKAAFTVGWSN